MLSYLFRQLINSFGIFFRTIRAFFTRKFVGLGARIRRITNFSRQATKVASDSFQNAATALKKPTKREDYVETRRLYVAKSFLILLVLGIAGAIALIYFFVWPFLLSHFFTAHLWQKDQKLPDWSGKVIVYYDEKKKQPMDSQFATFGMCSNPANPAVIAATAAALGVPTPAPCVPVIPTPWMPGCPTVLVCGKPLLNNTSKLMCAYGGVIQVAFNPNVTVQSP